MTDTFDSSTPERQRHMRKFLNGNYSSRLKGNSNNEKIKTFHEEALRAASDDLFKFRDKKAIYTSDRKKFDERLEKTIEKTLKKLDRFWPADIETSWPNEIWRIKINVTEAAAILEIHEDTVRRHKADGKAWLIESRNAAGGVQFDFLPIFLKSFGWRIEPGDLDLDFYLSTGDDNDAA